MDVTIAPESALQRAPLVGRWGFLCQQNPSRMALAWRVDGVLAGGLASRRGLAADSQRTRVLWSEPPVRSAATAHRTPSFRQGQGLPTPTAGRFAPHNKTPIKVRGNDYRTRRLS